MYTLTKLRKYSGFILLCSLSALASGCQDDPAPKTKTVVHPPVTQNILTGCRRCHDLHPDKNHNFDCNNWNDLMPLVVKHGISLEKVHFGEDTPYFVARDINLMVANKDPQLALALCLLKVLEAKEKANDS